MGYSGRDERPFSSVADLYQRTPVDSRALANLIKGGFLDALAHEKSGGRRELLEEAERLPRKRRGDTQRELCTAVIAGADSAVEGGWRHERPDTRRIASLPFPPSEEARRQREVLSLDVEEHPPRPYHEALKELKVTPARKIRDMPHGSRVWAAGIMECLQSPPTKSGKSVYFLLLEDETGLLQATIFSDVYGRCGHHLYQAASFLLEGVVEQDERCGFSFMAERIENLGGLLPRPLQRNGSVSGSGALLQAPKPSKSGSAQCSRAS